MRRLGKWLRSRGVFKVLSVLPPDHPLLGKTGVDDYLARGGTVPQSVGLAESTAPDPNVDDDSLTDSRLAKRVADEALADSFRWATGPLAWAGWSSQASGGRTPPSHG